MERFSAAITGIGLVTPAGIGTPANWKRVVEGKTTAAIDPELAKFPVRISCRVPEFTPENLVANPWQWDRFAQFALGRTLW